MTVENLADTFLHHLRALATGPGSAVLVEQRPQPDVDGRVRWWRCERFDLVRTADGGAWLVTPPRKVAHPPLFGLLYANSPGSVIEWAAANNAAVVPAEMPFARALELRLVAGVRR